MVLWYIRAAIIALGFTTLLFIIYISSLNRTRDLLTIQRANSHSSQKYVTVPFFWGRLGNQLYHLLSGLCIAKQLNRKFYVRYNANESDLRDAQLEQVNLIFPRFQHVYELKDPEYETSVGNANSSFDFVDPLQYINESAHFITMNVLYAQHWNYFRTCEVETRQLLTFADSVIEFGEQVRIQKQLDGHFAYTCVHIRRTDFLQYHDHPESTLPRTTTLLEHVFSLNNSRKVAIFGDDREFMKEVVVYLESRNQIEKGASYVSPYSEATDLYIASQICGSFLITSPASSFGFWLAYLTKNQDKVYYYYTEETVADKKISKSKFPSSWTALRVSNTSEVSQAR